MNTLLGLSAVDSPLGRVEKSSLPDLTLMELLIEGITTPDKIIRSRRSIYMWRGLYFTPKGLTEIKWAAYGLQGSIQLQWMPETVERARFAFNRLSGSVDLENLPGGLRELNVFQNLFSGTVSLQSLPNGLEILSLGSNEFDGVTDFSMLPGSLQVFTVSNTKLSGSITIRDGLLVEVQYSSVLLIK